VLNYDVTVIGSGLAGLSTALKLAAHKRIAIITKRTMPDGATNWAQGGIAAVLDRFDSHNSHVADTLRAGAGLCDPAVVKMVVESGEAQVKWLIDQGVQFTEDAESETGFHLAMEGGHSYRRIIHSADATGKAVQQTLETRVRAHPNITVLENHCAIDLIQSQNTTNNVVGLYAYNNESDAVVTIQSPVVVLATGGTGKSYLFTTNPDTATGDGVAIGWRAGCSVANMEFIQFHPTCLYHPDAKSFLITEAVRGEGGILKRPCGTPFMLEYDPRAELAPRDIVARSIDSEMKRYGLDFVHLDISHKGHEFITSHFPNIFKRCMELGINPALEPIPVVPAAHYTCGGIETTHDASTNIPGLYAVGETAHTGLHGANRLASNSLLECLVFSDRAAKHILSYNAENSAPLADWDDSRVTDSDEEVIISHNWDELRRFMWNYVGIVRTTKRLERALHRIELLKSEIKDYYSNFRVSFDLLELRNLVTVSELIVRSALKRHESRGLHYSLDYPTTLENKTNTVLNIDNAV